MCFSFRVRVWCNKLYNFLNILLKNYICRRWSAGSTVFLLLLVFFFENSMHYYSHYLRYVFGRRLQQNICEEIKS